MVEDKNKEIDKYKKQDQEVTFYDFVICPNCGADEVGKFCPNCGQSNKDYNKPMKLIFYDLLDTINIDVRLLNTLIPFFTKPGFLTKEYFKGRRNKYVPPLRMYMVFSILFFFLVQIIGFDEFDENFINIGETQTEEKVSSKLAKFNKVDKAFSIDSLKDIGNNNDTAETNYLTTENVTAFNKEELKQEILSDTSTSNKLKQAIVGGINASEKKELFMRELLSNISYMLFLLMPFFALILAMILWRSRMLYVKHLIFSINFHTFIFGLSSVILILSEIIPDKVTNIVMYLWWGIPLYLMLGIKQLYDRKIMASFFKTIGALSIYFLIIGITMILLLIFTAQGFYDM